MWSSCRHHVVVDSWGNVGRHDDHSAGLDDIFLGILVLATDFGVDRVPGFVLQLNEVRRDAWGGSKSWLPNPPLLRELLVLTWRRIGR